MVHALVISAVQDEHCSVNEYVHELSEPVDCGDICDIHHMFHVTFIIPDYSNFQPCYNKKTAPISHLNQNYQNRLTATPYRPPISA